MLMKFLYKTSNLFMLFAIMLSMLNVTQTFAQDSISDEIDQLNQQRYIEEIQKRQQAQATQQSELEERITDTLLELAEEHFLKSSRNIDDYETELNMTIEQVGYNYYTRINGEFYNLSFRSSTEICRMNQYYTYVRNNAEDTYLKKTEYISTPDQENIMECTDRDNLAAKFKNLKSKLFSK